MRNWSKSEATFVLYFVSRVRNAMRRRPKLVFVVLLMNFHPIRAQRRGNRRRFLPFMPRGTLCSVLFPFLPYS